LKTATMIASHWREPPDCSGGQFLSRPHIQSYDPHERLRDGSTKIDCSYFGNLAVSGLTP